MQYVAKEGQPATRRRERERNLVHYLDPQEDKDLKGRNSQQNSANRENVLNPEPQAIEQPKVKE